MFTPPISKILLPPVIPPDTHNQEGAAALEFSNATYTALTAVGVALAMQRSQSLSLSRAGSSPLSSAAARAAQPASVLIYDFRREDEPLERW